MSLNIKNPHVHDLARTVARRTGTSQTGAIELALTRYLAELDEQAQSASGSRRARVDRILADTRARLAGPNAADLSTDGLYDEHGLPR